MNIKKYCWMLTNPIRGQHGGARTSFFLSTEKTLDVLSYHLAGMDSSQPYASIELQVKDHSWPRYRGLKLRFNWLLKMKMQTRLGTIVFVDCFQRLTISM